MVENIDATNWFNLRYLAKENSSMIKEAEILRNPSNISNPDPRTINLVVIDEQYKYPRPISIQDQYDCISNFILNSTVPKSISTHFETAKNLYLYSWHVYRFYPVAEQQAFATLEYALRLRLPEFVNLYKKKHLDREPTLRPLIKHAKKNNILQNNLFPSRHMWATQIAKRRFRTQIHAKMISDGLNEIEYDDSNVTPTKEDLNHDWLDGFIELIPNLRNDLAHGSSTLHHTVIHTFDVISSMINQLYPEIDEPTSNLRSTSEQPLEF